MKKYWFYLLFIVYIPHISAQNDAQADKNCCPCPDTFTSGSRNVQSAASPLNNMDCPCLPRDFDSDPASSLMTSRVNGPSMRTPAQKDSKPLLHPEVDLASSVLQALHEATDVEYRDALERDNARSALKDISSDNEKHDNGEQLAKNLVTIVVNSPGVYDMEIDAAGEESHQQEARCALPIGQNLGASIKEISWDRPSLLNLHPLNSQRIPNFDIFDQGFAASSKENVKVPKFSARIPNLNANLNTNGFSKIKESIVNPLKLRNPFNLENIFQHKDNEKYATVNNEATESDNDFSPSIINHEVQQSHDCLNSNRESGLLRESPLMLINYPKDIKLKSYNIEDDLNAVEKLLAENVKYLSKKIEDNNMKLRNSFLAYPKSFTLNNNKHKIKVEMEPMKINSKMSSLKNTQNNNENSNNISKVPIDESVIETDIPYQNHINSNSLKVEDLEVMSNTLLKNSIKNENNELTNIEKQNTTFQPKQNTNLSEIKKNNKDVNNLFECEPNIDSNSLTNNNNKVDASGQASETFFKSLPLSESSKTLRNHFMKTLQQNKVVQPEFLLPRSSDISKLNIEELFKDLPSIDDIKEKVSEIFNIDEIKQKSPIISSLDNIQFSPPISKPLLGKLRMPTLRENQNIFPENGINFDIFRLQPLKSSLLLPSDLKAGLNINSFRTNLPNLQALPIKPIKLESAKKGNGNILGASLPFTDLDSHLDKIRSKILGRPEDNKIINAKQENFKQSHNLAIPNKNNNYAETYNKGKLLSKRPPSVGLLTVPTLKPLQLTNKELTSLPPSILQNNAEAKSLSLSPYNKALLMNVLTNTNFVDPIISKPKKDFSINRPDSLLSLPVNTGREGQPTKIVLQPLESHGFKLLDSNKNDSNDEKLGQTSVTKTVTLNKLPLKMKARKKPLDLKAILENDAITSKSTIFQTIRPPLKQMPLSITKSMKNYNIGTNKKLPVMNKSLKPKISNILGSQNHDLEKNLFRYPSTPLTESLHNSPLFTLGEINLAKPLIPQDIITSLSKQLSSSALFKPAPEFLKAIEKLSSKDMRESADTQNSITHNGSLKDKLSVNPLVNKLGESIDYFAKLSGFTYGNKNTESSTKDQNMLKHLENTNDSFDMNSANTCESPLLKKIENNNELDNVGETSNNIPVNDIKYVQSDFIPEVERKVNIYPEITPTSSIFKAPNNRDESALVHEEGETSFINTSVRNDNKCDVEKNTIIEKSITLDDLTSSDNKNKYPYKLLPISTTPLLSKLKNHDASLILKQRDKKTDDESIEDNESAQSSYLNIFDKDPKSLLSENIEIHKTHFNDESLQSTALDPLCKSKDLQSFTKLDKVAEGQSGFISSLLGDQFPGEDSPLDAKNISSNVILGDNDESQSENNVEMVQCADNSTSSPVAIRPLLDKLKDNFNISLNEDTLKITSDLSKEVENPQQNHNPVLDLANNIMSSLQYFTEINANPLANNTITADTAIDSILEETKTQYKKEGNEYLSEPTQNKVEIESFNKERFFAEDLRLKPTSTLLKDINIKPIESTRKNKILKLEKDGLVEPIENSAVTDNLNINTKLLAKPLNYNYLKDLIFFKERNKPSFKLFNNKNLNYINHNNKPGTIVKSNQENDDSLVEPTENVGVTQNINDIIPINQLHKDQSIIPDESNKPHIEKYDYSALTNNNGVLVKPLSLDALKDLISSIDKRKPYLQKLNNGKLKSNILNSTPAYITVQTTKEEDCLAERSESLPVTDDIKNIQTGILKYPNNINVLKDFVSSKPLELFEGKDLKPSVKKTEDSIMQFKEKDNSLDCTENYAVIENSNMQSEIIVKPFSGKDKNPIPNESESIETQTEEITPLDIYDIDSIVEPTENIGMVENPNNFKSIKVGNLKNFDNDRGPVFDALKSLIPGRIETTDEDECNEMSLAASDNLPTSLCAMGQPIDGNVSYKCKLICTKE